MTDWPHAPPHRTLETGTYMITSGTHRKEHFFNDHDKLTLLQNIIFDAVLQFEFNLEAWAVMSNHYHLILDTNNTLELVKKFISKVHGLSAIEINKFDNTSKRKIWYNYWDTHISYQKSYYARLNYVNKNPVHHGIVEKAEEYHWCSEANFKYNLDPAFSRTVNSFKFDEIKVIDDF